MKDVPRICIYCKHLDQDQYREPCASSGFVESDLPECPAFELDEELSKDCSKLDPIDLSEHPIFSNLTDYMDYLQRILIPSLIPDDKEETAKDFKEAIYWIKELQEKYNVISSNNVNTLSSINSNEVGKG
jgi:hypothetical protein